VLVFGHRARRGGVPTHLVDLARALPAVGVEPCFAIPEDVPWRAALEATGATLLAFEQRGKRDVLAPVRAARVIRASGAALVATHARPVDLWAGLGARLARVPAVATLHAEPARAPDGSTRPGIRGRAHGQVLRALHRRVIVVARPFVALARERLGVPEERLVVVENGVDPTGFASREAARARLGLPGSELGLGYVARFVDRGSEEKGQPDLVRALARTSPSFAVHFVGDGPSEKDVRALAEREGVAARVHFHGEQPSREVILGLDGLVLASRSEGCPYAVLEALAAGVPVIATAVGGVSDLLGGTGWLVPPGDAAALAAALVDWATHPEKRAAASAAGIARSRERYGLERFARETAAVYRAALSGAS
jgi:glycosyltransferase involved in cell wall biosynthesis